MSMSMPTGVPVDEQIGVPMKRAAEIIGVSRTRLVRWARHGILSPSSEVDIGVQHRWLYGITELTAGRVVRVIEDAGVSMARIAHMIRKYRSDDHPMPLLSMRWGVDRTARLAYVDCGDGWMDGYRLNQFVLPEVINIDEIRASVRQEAGRRRGAPGSVSRDRGKLGFKPVFAGTRVPVSAVRAWVQHGADDDRILEAYPAIELADIDLVREELRRAG